MGLPGARKISDLNPGTRLNIKVKPRDLPYDRSGVVQFRNVILMDTSSSVKGEKVITLKLENGYNVMLDEERIRIDGVLDDENIFDSEIRDGGPARTPSSVDSDEELPPITIISTGGTIASRVDYTTGAVHPVKDGSEILSIYPSMANLCRLDVRTVMNELSEDMSPREWVVIARAVKKAFEDGARGVVVTHGTDTMHFTSSALSFLLRDLPGPVVLVGSQRSSDRPSSDAFINLEHAVITASRAVLDRVVIISHEGPSDGTSIIISGTRARKMHTSRRDAIRSIDSPPIGRVVGKRIELDIPPVRLDPARKISIVGRFDRTVDMIFIHPGISQEGLDSMLKGKKGVVIVGSGLGHVGKRLIKVLKKHIDRGMICVISSACIHGRVDLNVYSSGRNLIGAGVIPSGTMTPETALVKLMWAMGTAGSEGKDRIISLFKEDIAGEWGSSTPFSEGL
ncbi:Glu-tRNA(Gln) amidotransferase GatDE subunit D [Thermoplasmatales archaeon ex4484_6]|nr:MAG: Glu-tRNA(Gln) amidotransferase GatDE subunit D [Thermoplasmatales archaeon ex4484_6]